MVEENIYFDERTTKTLFSIVFAFLFIFFLMEYPILLFIQNLLYLPFNILHEFGHFLLANTLLPLTDLKFEIQPINDGICSNTIRIEQLPVNWVSVCVMLAGSLFLSIIIVSILIHYRRKSSPNWKLFKKFLLFGLLYDLTNLFPIIPSILGVTNDGYSISVILLRMGYSTFPSFLISMLFSYCMVFLVLIAYYNLGSCIFHLITFPKAKLQYQLATEVIN
jgi:hypothetical protein